MWLVHTLASLIVIAGAVNWGLVGLFEYDFVASYLGGQDQLWSRVVYVVIGLAGVVLLFTSIAMFGRITAYREEAFEE